MESLTRPKKLLPSSLGSNPARCPLCQFPMSIVSGCGPTHTREPIILTLAPASSGYTPASQLAPAPDQSQQWQTQTGPGWETSGLHRYRPLLSKDPESHDHISSRKSKGTSVKKGQAPVDSEGLTLDRRRRVQAYQTRLHKCSWCDFCGIVARDKVKHEETVIKRGSNGNLSMVSCDQCGKVFCLRVPVHSCLDERLSEEMRSFGQRT